MTIKIARYIEGAEVPFEYDNTYGRERISGGIERLTIGFRDGHGRVLPLLGAVLGPPYKLLYVLHTSRTGAPLGRYESPALGEPEVEDLFHEYGSYFAKDARHDVWLHSRAGGPVVLDRYNVVYAYGPLERYARVLNDGGIRAVAAWALPKAPYPHVLHYHEQWDPSEHTLLSAYSWRRTALQPHDVQYWSGPAADRVTPGPRDGY